MAIELIDKIKQKNNGTFKLLDAIDVEMSDGTDLEHTVCEMKEEVSTISSDLNQHMENHPSGGGYHASDKPPEDTSLIWFDTSSSNVDETLDSIIIQEFRAVISHLQKTIVNLEQRVAYLELNGGGGGGGVTPSSNCLLMEDGSYLLFEEGSKILKETSGSIDSNCLLTESGNYLLFENSDRIKKEI